MAYRFLRGEFIAVDGQAFNDFETCSVVDIDDAVYELIGETDLNGFRFDTGTNFIKATQ